jgi:tetratricopeptide (TPR) repeat protein
LRVNGKIIFHPFGISEERIWAELAKPAFDALLSAGLELEAEAILARVPDARGRLEHQLRELAATLGPEDPEVLSLTERLARLLMNRGDSAGARRLEERVLQVKARVLGDEHPDTLAAMGNLAATLADQGDCAEARRLQERALGATTGVLGEEHPATLRAMNNLAATLGAQADRAGARRLEERVLEVSTRVLGAEHPDTLRAMNNLAATLSAQGDHAGGAAASGAGARLDSGTACLLDLFGETPRLQAAFNAQGVCDRQSVGGRRVGHGSTAPQRGRSEFLKGSAVEDRRIRHFLAVERA